MEFLEALEERRFLSAGGHPTGGDAPAKHHGKPKPTPAMVLPKNAVKLAGRNLQIQGTKSADVISVAPNPDDPTKLDVTYNGVVKTLPAGKIKRIMVNGKGGDDSITIDPAVTLSAHLHGGPGNDTLTAGSGNDKLFGGAGADHFGTSVATEIMDLDSTQGDTSDVLTLPDDEEVTAGDGGV